MRCHQCKKEIDEGFSWHVNEFAEEQDDDADNHIEVTFTHNIKTSDGYVYCEDCTRKHFADEMIVDVEDVPIVGKEG